MPAWIVFLPVVLVFIVCVIDGWDAGQQSGAALPGEPQLGSAGEVPRPPQGEA